MSKVTRAVLAAGVLAAVGLGALALQPRDADAQTATRVGAKAPAFSLPGSDGKTHTLESLQKLNGTTYLYFIKDGCPVNNQAIPFYNRLYSAYKDKVSFVGVFNGDKARFEAFKKQFNPPFVVLLDPDKTLVRAYEVQRSPSIVQIDKGNIAHRWRTYSVGELKELQASFDKASGARVNALDFAGAPTSPRAG